MGKNDKKGKMHTDRPESSQPSVCIYAIIKREDNDEFYVY